MYQEDQHLLAILIISWMMILLWINLRRKIRPKKVSIFLLIFDIIVFNIPFCIAKSFITKLFDDLEAKKDGVTPKVNEVTPAASSKKRKACHHSDES